MIGQHFGKLTVLKQDLSNPKTKLWLCSCQCGKEYLVEENKLLNKTVTHCLCNRGDDLKGKRYERLVALCSTSLRTSDRCVIWKCQCDCGKIVYVSAKSLKQGNTKSCGCLNTETRAALGKTHKKDLTGQTFGKLTVLGDFGDRKDNAILWKCKCACGAIIYVKGISLKTGHTTSCGCTISKGEEKISQLLTQNNIPFEKQKTFSSCRFNSGRPAFFDFYVNNQYLIEYDGLQHFTAKHGGWNTEENVKLTQERDAIKNAWCKENKIPLIRIPYWKYDTLTIEDLLLNVEDTAE